jgi:dTDP-L-rhamnose 4-epimerase
MKSRRKVLITGGAGFIGSNLARALIKKGFTVTILDNFIPQVHAGEKCLPADLAGKATLVLGDVTDRKTFFRALEGQSAVVHLAAETGTGQSMYKIEHYTDVNVGGTAILCDYLVNRKHNIKKVIVASSRAIYGEGKYQCRRCGIVYPANRPAAALSREVFEPACPLCGRGDLAVRATDEGSKLNPLSIYGITKQVQEQMVLMTARLTGISAFALRYQNVFGPGQSLNNPYTGILSIFSRLALNDENILIFEDGKESRDFVNIEDVVAATVKCLLSGRRGQYALNVGSGQRVTVLFVAQSIVKLLKSRSRILINGSFREGDIRHNYADLARLKKIIGFKPKIKFLPGLAVFLRWVKKQTNLSGANDYLNSLQEMKNKGLLYGADRPLAAKVAAIQ